MNNDIKLQEAIAIETKELINLLNGLNNYLANDLSTISIDERRYMVDKIRIEYGKAAAKLNSISFNAVTLLNREESSIDGWEYDPITFLKP